MVDPHRRGRAPRSSHPRSGNGAGSPGRPHSSRRRAPRPSAPRAGPSTSRTGLPSSPASTTGRHFVGKAGRWRVGMAGIYELMLTVDLRDDVARELDELRWHLGLGPQPEDLRIGKEFPQTVVGDQGELVVQNDPVALLACHGAATRLTGALVSILAHGGGSRGGEWALTGRQEFHPDAAEGMSELLPRLARNASGAQRGLLTGAFGWDGPGFTKNSSRSRSPGGTASWPGSSERTAQRAEPAAAETLP